VEAGTISLRLAYRAPLHVESLLGFLARRALPGVEECDGKTYRRGLTLPHGDGTVALTPGERWVSATLQLADVRDLAPAVARCRRLFDLDADPDAVDATLSSDPALAAAVRAEPGVRVPRSVDGFEMAVRAIVGQQVSVAGARTTLGRLIGAARAGLSEAPPEGTELPPAGPTDGVIRSSGLEARGTGQAEASEGLAGGGPGGLSGFPPAAVVAELPDAAFGMPVARRESIRALARVVAAGELDIEPGADRDETIKRLMDLPGIGAWTAGYVAMRAIGDPDVFLPTDLAIRRGARALGLPHDPRELAEHAQRWSPWRSYALIRLWRAA
jgi:AraC family transcriptional regulator of adaptative response / DNA-3-methyladenine glycosylase II